MYVDLFGFMHEMRSGSGEARTILLLHIISVRPSKQPLMVRTFFKVYMELCSSFLFLQEQIKDIIITGHSRSVSRSTCPPLSPSPHANSLTIGTAVINTHCVIVAAPVHACDVTGSVILSDRYREVTVPSGEIKRRGFSGTKGFCSR
jgi:hypothetical protein